jgi:hypothetical protein
VAEGDTGAVQRRPEGASILPFVRTRRNFRCPLPFTPRSSARGVLHLERPSRSEQPTEVVSLKVCDIDRVSLNKAGA